MIMLLILLQIAWQGVTIKSNEAITPKEGHKGIKGFRATLELICATQKHEKRISHQFIDICERVEAVWGLLQRRGATMVALFGIGGVGGDGILF